MLQGSTVVWEFFLVFSFLHKLVECSFNASNINMPFLFLFFFLYQELLISILFIGCSIQSYILFHFHVDDWRDIAHPREAAKMTRPRVLGTNCVFIGFGSEYEITSPNDPLLKSGQYLML
jgi:hypothetical protein